MMMDCPRCGFNQPKDRYCANCGLDVDQFLAKPKPFWLRVVQNPVLHISLIVALILLIVAYIVYTQRDFVKREMGLGGQPLLSRDAADPNEEDSRPARGAAKVVRAELAVETSEEEVASGGGAEDGAADAALAPPAGGAAGPGVTGVAGPGAAAALPPPQRLDLTFLEIDRETLMGFLTFAEKLGESSGGRAFLFKDASKIVEALNKAAKSLNTHRSTGLQSGGQVVYETPPNATDALQFGFFVQVTKWENKEASLRWEASLAMAPEGSSSSASGPAAGGPTGTTGATGATAARGGGATPAAEVSLSGSTQLDAQGAVILVFEAIHRKPREDAVARLSSGPWSIFLSDEFRGGISDWIAVIDLK